VKEVWVILGERCYLKKSSHVCTRTKKGINLCSHYAVYVVHAYILFDIIKLLENTSFNYLLSLRFVHLKQEGNVSHVKSQMSKLIELGVHVKHKDVIYNRSSWSEWWCSDSVARPSISVFAIFRISSCP
jgi:hypothetical protein